MPEPDQGEIEMRLRVLGERAQSRELDKALAAYRAYIAQEGTGR